MERLFTLDENNYTEDMPLTKRIGIRGLIHRGNLWAMQYAEGYEYKIPGGGREAEETDVDTLKREVREETGLVVIEDTIREIGEILEKRRDLHDMARRYVASSHFYFCKVTDEEYEPTLTPSERAKGYRLVWADLDTIIANNEKCKQEHWLKRDLLFLKWLREHPELIPE